MAAVAIGRHLPLLQAYLHARSRTAPLLPPELYA
jgi:hypothetical protein